MPFPPFLDQPTCLHDPGNNSTSLLGLCPPALSFDASLTCHILVVFILVLCFKTKAPMNPQIGQFYHALLSNHSLGEINNCDP